MPKKTAVAATPAPGPAALACGNGACGKALAPPLLQCSKCKAEAYCGKACQVGDPATPATHCAPHASARSPALAPVPPAASPCRQTAAWKAGHKRECGAPGRGQDAAVAQPRGAAPGGARTDVAQQMRLLMRLIELKDADGALCAAGAAGSPTWHASQQ